jgi:hypothetical protein
MEGGELREKGKSVMLLRSSSSSGDGDDDEGVAPTHWDPTVARETTRERR